MGIELFMKDICLKEAFVGENSRIKAIYIKETRRMLIQRYDNPHCLHLECDIERNLEFIVLCKTNGHWGSLAFRRNEFQIEDSVPDAAKGQPG